MNRIEETSAARLQKGFTLIELLVVLVIIGLLAGLVAPKFMNRADGAKVSTAQAQIKMLRGALETMRLDIGRFPTATEGLALLNEAPKDERLAGKWKGPYLSDALPSDPWGNPYQYAVPGASGQPFALYSFGADGKRGGESFDADVGLLPQ
ncbi:type II secretion system major pseudopilin GspG [Paucibacter sp. APW11]|uniref:Type II secretion system core protein G n=1 Tax=Roseateles aquae TaxID=3077235 RepID=A0ABU3PGV6_9BURK|nr:type II secretion system major pseudopilin GspG [Paucibacter sp. APW11]MDT9001246.1 type II secretion system major pseudopilin GspG [Paucibacter sp. APW11]